MRVQTLIVFLLGASLSSSAQLSAELVDTFKDKEGMFCQYILNGYQSASEQAIISYMDSIRIADSCSLASFHDPAAKNMNPNGQAFISLSIGVSDGNGPAIYTGIQPNERKNTIKGLLFIFISAGIVVIAWALFRKKNVSGTTSKHPARLSPQQWAQSILAQPDQYIILDTETTGLEYDDVVIEIAAIDLSGTELINTRVLPDCEFSISRSASQIHGITKKQLQNAPTFRAVMQQLSAIATDKTILIYNAEYDTRLLAQTAMKEGWSIDLKNTSCVMLPYAEYIGEWSDYHGNYRFQKLPGGDHTAIGDCRATLKVIHKMASTA